MTDISTVARAQSLLDELAAARADAVRWEFDLPSDLAYQRAETLLRMLCRSSVSTEIVEIAIGDDGDIEIVATPIDDTFIVRIPPSGTVMRMSVLNYPTRTIVSYSEDLAEFDIVERIERAISG